MSELVTFSEEESYCLLHMDDGKANALGFDMFEAINAALDKAEQAGKVVLITGRPGKFSAGFDLSVMGGDPADMTRLVRTGAELSRRLLQFPTPIVLAVSGHALAMGAILCMSADYRVGIKGNYKIGLNEVAIGMTLPWFGVEIARFRLAPGFLDRAVGLAQVYDADGAVEAGYLDQSVDEDQLMATATGLATMLSGIDMNAHKNTKARVREPLMVAFEEGFSKDFASGSPIAND